MKPKSELIVGILSSSLLSEGMAKAAADSTGPTITPLNVKEGSLES